MATVRSLIAKANAWPAVATLFIGIIIGFATGVWFYAKFIDKPEMVTKVEIGTQKIKGDGNTVHYENTPKVEVSNKKRTWFWNRDKNKEDKR